MKKICFVVDSIRSLGGIQRAVCNLVNHLQQDYDITIVNLDYISKKNYVDYQLDSKIQVIDFSAIGLQNFYLVFFKLLKKLNSMFHFLNSKGKIYQVIMNRMTYVNQKKLLSFLNHSNFSYLLTTGLNNCILFSELKREISVPIIGCWHSSFDRYVHDSEYSIDVIRNSLEQLDDTVVLTKNDAKQIKDTFGIDTFIIPNPIVSFPDNKSSLKAKTFVAVGRYDKIKRFDLLIEMFYQFNQDNPDWNLFLVGDGPERKNLQQLIERYHLTHHVFLTGQTNHVGSFYQKASVFLMTSKHEGFPMVIVEAMSYGLPILAFSLPVLHEVLTDEMDSIVSEGDREGYLSRMHLLANDFELRKKMGNYYSSLVGQYSIDRIVSKWKEILK